MPTINKPFILPNGDSMELLETSDMTGGARVRARIVFGATGVRVPAHIHPYQDETYEIISGKLTYFLEGTKQIAPAGCTICLPRGVAHQHFSEGPEEAVTIQTVTPGLDFDYVLETVFGLVSEGRPVTGLQGLVVIRKMKGAFVLASLPIWLQTALAWILTPLAYLLGYRAVYKRFSGEEW